MKEYQKKLQELRDRYSEEAESEELKQQIKTTPARQAVGSDQFLEWREKFTEESTLITDYVHEIQQTLKQHERQVIEEKIEDIEGVQDIEDVLQEIASADITSTQQKAFLKQTKKTAKEKEGLPEVGVGDMEEDLATIENQTETTEQKEEKQKIEGERREKALKFLNRNQVHEEVNQKLGEEIVGEEENRQLCFLSKLTALLEGKVHYRSKGASGGGKSHVMNTVSDFFPEEMFALRKTRVSATYFEYKLQGQDLDGKIIEVQEFEGAEDAIVSLRPLLSGDQDGISAGIVDTGSGEIKPRDLEASGKPVFQTASTQLQLDHEFETRTWKTEIDESEKQTRRILRHEAQNELEVDVESQGETRVKDAIRLLRDEGIRNVINPYSLLLAENLPAHTVRMRRDFKKILAFIKAHAFMNQYNRPVVKLNNREAVLSTPEDYESVRNLIQESFSLTVTDLDSHLEDTLEAVREKESPFADEETEIEGVTPRVVASYTNNAESTARKYLNNLVEDGYLDKDYHPSDGRKRIYKLSEAEKHEKIQIPTFEECLSSEKSQDAIKEILEKLEIQEIVEGRDIIADDSTEEFKILQELFDSDLEETLSSVGNSSIQVLSEEEIWELDRWRFVQNPSFTRIRQSSCFPNSKDEGMQSSDNNLTPATEPAKTIHSLSQGDGWNPVQNAQYLVSEEYDKVEVLDAIHENSVFETRKEAGQEQYRVKQNG